MLPQSLQQEPHAPAHPTSGGQDSVPRVMHLCARTPSCMFMPTQINGAEIETLEAVKVPLGATIVFGGCDCWVERL